MKRSPKPPLKTSPASSKRGKDDEDRYLRYSLFDAACRIIEGCCRAEDLPRFWSQRAELEKRLGFQKFRRAQRTECYAKQTEAERKQIRDFMHAARRRIKAALKQTRASF